MTQCDRCGEYAYYPLSIAALTEYHLRESREMGDGIILFEGWDNRDVLCRDCRGDLAAFMRGDATDGL